MQRRRHDEPPQELTDNKSNPEVRQVLEDFALERGWRGPILGQFLLSSTTAGDDNSYDGAHDDAADRRSAEHQPADCAADAASGHDSDCAGKRDADSDATIDRDYNDDSVADMASGTENDAATAHNRALFMMQESDMRNGLKIIQIRGVYWAVTRICWVRRVGGDEYEEMPGARTITRKAGEPCRTIGSLAAIGLGRDHVLSEPDAEGDELHRLLIIRSKPANEGVWARYCPRPPNWTDTE